MTDKNTQIIMKDSIATDMLEISTTPKIIETSQFTAMLENIPKKVAYANQLLGNFRQDPDQFLIEHDESDVDELLKELNVVSKYKKEIDTTRKEIKSYFTQMSQDALSFLDQRLIESQFDNLTEIVSDVKVLKDSLGTVRKTRRWSELQQTFEANVVLYPIIQDMAPDLLDFGRFKLLFPKMVSGAKTVDVKKKDHVAINHIIHEWSQALEAIKSNVWGLYDTYIERLLFDFVKDPKMSTVIEKSGALKQQQIADIQRAASLEQQRLKAEELKKERELQQVALLEAAKNQPKTTDSVAATIINQQQVVSDLRMKEQEAVDVLNQYIKPHIKDSFPHTIDYLVSNPSYQNLHGSSRIKAMALYEIMRLTAVQNSVVVKDTGCDPDRILDLVQFILSV